MDLACARETRVVHLPGLLSEAEIKQIHAAAAGAEATAWSDAATEVRTIENTWRVLYLQTNHWFQKSLPEIRQRVHDAVVRVDREQGWGLLAGAEDKGRVRCAEYHRMAKGGSLGDPTHYDAGSMVTLDIMLTRPGEDFEGGHFSTEEADGTIRQHSFDQGGRTYRICTTGS